MKGFAAAFAIFQKQGGEAGQDWVTKKRKSTVSLFEDSESLKWKYDEKWVTICYQSEFCWAEAAWGDTKIKSFITPVPYLFA